MHQVKIGTRTKAVASSWNELSLEQLLRLLPILYGHYTREEAQRLRVLPVLLGISPTFLLKFTVVQLIEIKWLADFLLDEPCTLTRQLVPRVRSHWYRRGLWGPSAELSNLRFLEFVFADSYFVAYCQSQDATLLDQLLAVLYRPGRYWGAVAAGDQRQPFNENLLERNTARVARLPQLVKLAILTWYRGCRHGLEQRYPLVFTPAGEEKAQGHRDGWSYVLREVSGQAFGDFEQTGRQHLHTVLAKMQDDLARAAELKPATP